MTKFAYSESQTILFSCDVTEAMLVFPINPPGIALYFCSKVSFVLIEKHVHWSRESKRSIVASTQHVPMTKKELIP